MNNISLIEELKKHLVEKRFAEYSEIYSNNSSKLSEKDLSEHTNTINRLTKDEKKELKMHLLSKFPQINDSHIFSLISKTKTRAQLANNEIHDNIRNLYIILNKIQQIELILKVIQYNTHLEIIFDFDTDSVNHIQSTSDQFVNGRMDTELDKIFIGAKINDNDENNLSGAIARELCRLAMQMLFKNHAKPYDKNDSESVEKFKKMNKGFNEQIKQGIIIDKDGIIKLVYDNYKQDKWDAELIATVPHILAHYKENGPQILNDNAKE